MVTNQGLLKTNEGIIPMKFIFSAFFTMLAASCVFCQVNLGGTVVPKDNFRVFIFLGHSNMDGRGELLDTVTNPRLWMWDISRIDPNPDYPSNGLAGTPRDSKWRLSRDVAVGHSAGRPATPFLKKMLAAYPGYYFGVIQLSEWESIIPQAYLPGMCWYVRIMNYVNQFLPNVTLQAVVTMLGWDDGCTAGNAGSFDVNYTSMANQIRIDLSLPKLPFVVSQQEAGHGCDNNVQPALIEKTNNIPKILAFSDMVQSSGPYVDDHHYNTEGLNKWADSAVALIKRKGWGPPAVNADGPPVRTKRLLQGTGCAAVRIVYGFDRGRRDFISPVNSRGVGIAVVSPLKGVTLFSLSGERLGLVSRSK
jgi:hypothetical protein